LHHEVVDDHVGGAACRADGALMDGRLDRAETGRVLAEPDLVGGHVEVPAPRAELVAAGHPLQSPVVGEQHHVVLVGVHDGSRAPLSTAPDSPMNWSPVSARTPPTRCTPERMQKVVPGGSRSAIAARSSPGLICTPSHSNGPLGASATGGSAGGAASAPSCGAA